MESQLREWISSQLFSLVGLSERYVVDFILATAKASKSVDSLASSLLAAGIPSTHAAENFARELFAKIPRAGEKSKADKGKDARKKIEEEALEEAVKAKSYSFVDYPPLSPSAEHEQQGSAIARSQKRAKHIRRKESENGDDWENDATEVKTHSDIEEEEEAKQTVFDADELDIKERDEFEARLRQRDFQKAEEKRKIQDTAASHHGNLANDLDARKAALPHLREYSRRLYLGKREAQEIQLLKRKIEDEEILFRDHKLTEAERRRLESDKELVRLVEKTKQLEQEEQTAYRMPSNYIDEKGMLDKKKRDAALYSRYKDVQRADTGLGEWERSQIAKNVAEGRTEKGESKDEDYDFVFDESQIEFIAEAAAENDVIEEDALKLSVREVKRRSIQETRRSLPIYPFREELLTAVNDHQILVIVGETGSGKTTQIPQYLREAGYSKGFKIGCTQPRRVAAISVAARVAEEMGVKLGYEVGYSIRFEDCSSDKTLIKYMTDGMLLREFLTDPLLSEYSAMIIDEAHERTLHTDILFALIKDIACARPELKILISSATLDAQKFSDYFGQAPIFSIPGRMYPVTKLYAKAPESDYIAATIQTIMQIHVTQPPGDVLAFLTGQEEIEAIHETLSGIVKSLGSRIAEMIIAPVYSALPTEMQGEIFKPTPPGARKIVLATNIAETSITIDGIVYVIDPGFVKQKNYDPKTGMESLTVVPCSKASANQRAGRAGRVGPGKCYRIYTSWAYHNELEDSTIPEIQRTNLGNVVLLLLSMGIVDLVNFDFMDAPSPAAMKKALQSLYELGALNEKGQLTTLGRKMAEFPLDPPLAKVIIASDVYGCANEIISVVALLNVGNTIFYRPKDKRMHADRAHKCLQMKEGDHLTLLNVWNQWASSDFGTSWCFENFVQARSMRKARDIREQLERLLDRVEIPLSTNPDDNIAIRKCFASGYFAQCARLNRSGDGYKSIKGQHTMYIHPSSGLIDERPECVLYHELVLTAKEYMRCVTEVQPEWLVELAPHFYSAKEVGSEKTLKTSRNIGRASNSNISDSK